MKKITNTLIIILYLTIFLNGGYFHYISSLLSIFLFILYLFILFKTKRIVLGINFNTLALFIFILFYLISSIWAIDSEMSYYGFIKFLPLFLFYLIVHYIDDKERILYSLPFIGAIITVFSFLCMQFHMLNGIAYVNHRLAGFIQYPNTYALFMLLCLIISIDNIHVKNYKKQTIYIFISLFGILMSCSKSIYIFTLLSLIVLFFIKKNLKKYIGIGLVITIILFVIFLLIYNPSISLSTFYGRLLYYKDAIPLIISHPFGLGYYGYFFIQNTIQTGVYSIINVHNDFLQIALDIGIIPSVFFYVMMIKSIIRTTNTKKLLLSIILLHSLFDYDLQFIFICFILILLLDFKNIKIYDISFLTQGFISICFICLSVFCVKLGISDYFYTSGNYYQALSFYKRNTMAQVYQLISTTNYNEQNELIQDIIDHNSYISYTYVIRAQHALNEGNIEYYIENQIQAIELNPYNYQEYIHYYNTLIQCVEQYYKSNDLYSAEYCLNRLNDIPNMLKSLKEKTSSIAYKTIDKPFLELSSKQLSKIKELEQKIENVSNY